MDDGNDDEDEDDDKDVDDAINGNNMYSDKSSVTIEELLNLRNISRGENFHV